MASERFEMRMPVELLERIDAVRGHEKRASWIKRTLESALTNLATAGESKVGAPDRGGLSAPSRASAKKTAVALEVREAVAARNRPVSPSLGKGFVPPRPKGS